jgi:FRG domain
MNEVRVKTWNELQDALFSDSYSPGLERFRSPFVFRGTDDEKYKLDTTLIRLGGKDHSRRVERHLLRNFQKYAHRDVVERDSFWYWLSVAQHYGLPTRLLDWTYSPFVAMHFATADMQKLNVDGAIGMVNYFRAHDNLPEKLRKELDRVKSHAFDVDMLSNVIKSLSDLRALSEADFTIFFEPPSIDDRIVNQYALFSVMSNATITFDEWLSAYPNVFYKIIIPANLKWEVRDKLDQANMTERVLFPGLDGLSKWLKRNYSPKG